MADQTRLKKEVARPNAQNAGEVSASFNVKRLSDPLLSVSKAGSACASGGLLRTKSQARGAKPPSRIQPMAAHGPPQALLLASTSKAPKAAALPTLNSMA